MVTRSEHRSVCQPDGIPSPAHEQHGERVMRELVGADQALPGKLGRWPSPRPEVRWSPVRDRWPHLDGTTHPRLGDARCDGDRGIEVLRLDHEETADRVLQVDVRAVHGDG